MRRKPILGVVLLAALAGAAGVRAQAPLGGEFQVNELATGQAFSGAVSMATDGSFVAVWRGDVSTGTDADGASIQARRYDPAGSALGAQFQVNSATTGAQTNPAVAPDPGGGFLIVWNSPSTTGNDAGTLSIQGQRYDDNGSPIAGQFQVNSYTTGNQLGPTAAFAPTGEFVVSWISSGSAGGDTSLESIQARRFDAGGAPLAADFQVNAYTTGRQQWPQVGVDGTDAFVVAWESAGTSTPGAQGYSVLARRFGSDGLPIAGELQVNSYTTGIQSSASLAVRTDGSFLVVWESEGSLGSDSASFSVQARRYDATGAALGPEFQVNSYTTSYQTSPAVALDASGGFVVAWSSLGSPGSDALSWSVQGRPFDNAGVPVADQFQVNSSTTGTQNVPGIATDGAGGLVVAWRSDPAQNLGGSDPFLIARRYRSGIFIDGFESSDTLRWSLTAP